MKANELRIGNLVLFLEKVITIKGISTIPTRNEMYWIEAEEGICNTKIIHFKPIPLTEEWLVRLPEDLVSEDIPSWIKFVHHLQNWYWAENYCKKELIFK